MAVTAAKPNKDSGSIRYILPHAQGVIPLPLPRSADGQMGARTIVAERHVIAERYQEWEIAGPPEVRGDEGYSYFRPYPPRTGPASNVEHKPELDRDERYLVLFFLRRYVTYCARRGGCLRRRHDARCLKAGTAGSPWRR